ncbi:T9SS type A sorting domain-containing protein [Psychroserpens burtonensis]|uniref:T9SS type A sorting domain-containing protein n=2 Tax=Psychroserpens burtonensis TaxID=49278 RepID=A0A5C7B5F3_9FLAO|nr:T9SS type A sorting domain-containing protein [Psychroserpens burtonensis]
MEDNQNLDHDTSLYISHDAPHQGANIPLGIQFLARHLSDQFVSTPVGDFDLPAAGGGSVTISDIQDVFNSPGTRQLLSNTINGNFNIDNAAFDTWQADLQLLGYPTQTRNIAISNGSHCANFQELGVQQELLFLSGDIEPTILLDIIINYFPLLIFGENIGYAALAIILDDPAYLAGLLPGRTNLNARFEAKTLPNNGQTANIYKGRIRITKKINFLLFTLAYNINITNREEDNPSTVQLPFDSYPGGFYPVSFDLASINDESINNWLVNLNLTGRSANSFNFISTPTALDVGGGNTTLNNADYLIRYNAENPPTGSKAIPFDNFTTSLNNGNTNEAHISFNPRNGDWLAAELSAVIPNYNFDCTFICDNNGTISGPGLLCNTANYSVDIPAATDIDWTITPANAATITENMFDVTQITITRAGGYNGTVTLNASVDTNRCGNNISFNKTIHFGRLTVNGSVLVTGDSDLYPGPTDSAVFTVNTSNVRVWNSIDWVIFSNSYPNASINFNIQSTGGSGNTVVVTANSSTPEGNYTIQSRVTNSCGFYPVNKTFYVNEAGDPQFYPRMATNYSVYPNPSKDIVHIDLVTNEKEQTQENTKVSGELFDVLGKSKLKVDMQRNGAQFNVSRLHPGVYVLKIYVGENIETHQVLVK